MIASRTILWLALLMLTPTIVHGQGCAGSSCERPENATFLSRAGAGKGGIPRHLQKVSTSVREVVTRAQGGQISTDPVEMSIRGPSAGRVRVNTAREIHVYVILTEFRPEHVTHLEALGLRVERALPETRLLQGWLPTGAIDTAAALDFVKDIRSPDYAVRRGSGAASTAGDVLMRADVARAMFGASGAGVKVGVISTGVDHLGDSMATGDLPPAVQVLQPGSGDEGTAILEIVHDLAPGATLAFYGPSTSADMVNAITSLGAAGARVVVDDLGFYSEPKFQDGMVAQTTRSFATEGRVYVTAAGNNAEVHYRGGYNRLAVETPGSDYVGLHNYAGGDVDIGNSLVLPNGCTLSVFLQWNNPFGAARDDLDLFISRSGDGSLLAASVDVQDGTQDPLEIATWTNSTGSTQAMYIAVAEYKLTSAPASIILDYFTLLSCVLPGGLQYVQSADSIFGHPAVTEVVSVAALDAATPATAQVYSSQGPASISFPAPEIRNVPSASGIDCVSTRAGQLGFFFEPFCGTSAAAPHVAAIAALLIERVPALSSAELRDILTKTAVDLGSPGFDFVHGFGRVDAVNALAAAPPNTQVFLSGALFHPGQVLTVGLWAQNPSGQTPLDLYVGAVLPDGQTLVFFTAPGVLDGPGSLGAPAFVAKMQMAAGGFVLNTPTFFEYTFPPDLPAGAYLVFAALIEPGTLLDNSLDASDIVDLSVVPFTFSP